MKESKNLGQRANPLFFVYPLYLGTRYRQIGVHSHWHRVGCSITLGLGLALAFVTQATGFEEFIPTNPESYLAPTPYAPEPDPADSYTDPGYDDPNYPEPAYEEPGFAPDYAEPAYSEEPIDTAVPLVPAPSAPLNIPQSEAQSPANSPLTNPDSANLYIDATDYSIGATGSYESPATVIFSERSTGCETVVGLGDDVSGLCASTPPGVATGNGLVPPGSDGNPIYNQLGVFGSNNPQNVYNGADSTYGSVGNWADSGSGFSGGSSGQIPIARLGGSGISPMTGSGLAYYNRTKRPPALAGNGDTSLLFPLSIPAPITSLFGWRQHPVLGYGRFHTGIDVGADTGTPVVASYSGQVSIADWLGGYGLAVVLDHGGKSQETLYGHLSELFVKSGEQVKQGEVIGRVGSTGMSTGPHLHFELRRLTDQGWVAINPQNQIEFALAGLLKVLKVAEVPSASFIATLPDKIKDAETGVPQLPPLPPGMDIMVPQLEPPTTNFGFKEDLELRAKQQPNTSQIPD